MRRYQQRLESLKAEAHRTPEEAVEVNGVRICENTDQGGIEIHFPGKPAPEVLTNLKACGWRWARGSKCWYKRRGYGVMESAKAIAESASKGGA